MLRVSFLANDESWIARDGDGTISGASGVCRNPSCRDGPRPKCCFYDEQTDRGPNERHFPPTYPSSMIRDDPLVLGDSISSRCDHEDDLRGEQSGRNDRGPNEKESEHLRS